MHNSGKLQLLAAKEVAYNEELYVLVDFLNRSLKDKGLVFGLTREGDDKAVIKIYKI
ncbi:MAG: YpmA family protein [Clostridiales bacterium]|nr:YpmA family protein [Clostridiales bacterium]